MNTFFKSTFIFLTLLILSSCNQNSDYSSKLKDIRKLNCLYGFNETKIKVLWNAYKTTDKIKVSGYFDNFSTDRKGIYSSSIEELINGIRFSIISSSSFSGDIIRDTNVKDYFFKLFSENYKINGSLELKDESKIIAHLYLFGKDRLVSLSYSISNEILTMEGSISLKEIGAFKAFNSIHEKCIDLHRGSDGISKTWDQVDVLIEIPIDKDCR